MGKKAVLHQQKIAFKLCGIAVGRRSVHGLAATLQLVKHIREKAAVTFCRVMRPPSQVHSWNRALVVAQARKQFFGNARLATRRTKAVAQRLNVVEIFAEDQSACHFQRVTNAVGLDQWVAVAISTDPRAEVHEVGQEVFVKFKTVDFAEGLHHFGIKFWKRIKQRQPEVTQTHANFIVHGWLRQADFVGLPERGDLGTDHILAGFGLFGRERKTVKTFQLSRDATTLQQNSLPGHLGGMGGENRRDRDLAERRDGVLRRNSGLFHAQKRSPE